MARALRLLRPGALLVLAAITVHELRFLVGFGAGDEALAHDERAYLSLGLSVAGVLLLLAGCAFLHDVVCAKRGASGTEPPPLGFARAWLATSITLVLVYSGQELLEGLIVDGHPGGLTGILGHAGWTALVFAVVLGAAVAALLRGARAAIVRARARGVRSRPQRARKLIAAHSAVEGARPMAGLLGLHLAGRAPPLPSR